MTPFLLLYGQPESGKTTISNALAKKWGGSVLQVDGDEIRGVLGLHDYSMAGRIRALESGYAAALIAYRKLNIPVIISMVSPYRFIRDGLKASEPSLKIAYLRSSRDSRREHWVTAFDACGYDISVDTDRSLSVCVREIDALVSA